MTLPPLALSGVQLAPPATHDVRGALDEVDDWADELGVEGGEIVFELDGTPVGSGQAAQLVRGEELGTVRLAVEDFDYEGDAHFTTVLEGEPPEGSGVGTTAEEMGAVLLDPEAYEAVDEGIGMANIFGDDVVDQELIEHELALDPDAPTGEWTLHWALREVDLDADPPQYGDAYVVASSHTFEVVDAEDVGVGGFEVAGLVAAVLLVLIVLAQRGQAAVGRATG